MGVDVLQGSPYELVVPSGNLGSAAGRNVAIGNISWNSLLSSFVGVTTTATVGNRNLALRFLDAAGNILWQSVSGTQQVPSATFLYQLGGFLAAGYAANSAVSWPAPSPLLLPPGSSFTVLDALNIDPTDHFNAVMFFGT